jgi:hypothetical protein
LRVISNVRYRVTSQHDPVASGQIWFDLLATFGNTVLSVVEPTSWPVQGDVRELATANANSPQAVAEISFQFVASNNYSKMGLAVKFNYYSGPEYGAGTVNFDLDYFQICEAPAPPTIVQTAGVYCPSGPPVTLTAYGSGSSYLWDNGSTSQSISVAPTTNTTYNYQSVSTGYSVGTPYECRSQSTTSGNIILFNTTYKPTLETDNIVLCPWDVTEIRIVDAGNNPPFYSFLWSNGATASSITTGPGTYTVNVLTVPPGAPNQCWVTGGPLKIKQSNSISCYAREATKPEEETTTSLTIYPNPVADELKIDFGHKLEFKNKIELVDNHGIQRHESVADTGTREVSISTKELADGLYTVVLKENLFRKSYHVVVRH